MSFLVSLCPTDKWIAVNTGQEEVQFEHRYRPIGSSAWDTPVVACGGSLYWNRKHAMVLHIVSEPVAKLQCFE